MHTTLQNVIHKTTNEQKRRNNSWSDSGLIEYVISFNVTLSWGQRCVASGLEMAGLGSDKKLG